MLIIVPERCEKPWEKTAWVPATADVAMMSSHLSSAGYNFNAGSIAMALLQSSHAWLTLNRTFSSLKNIIRSFRQASLWHLRQSAPSNPSAQAQFEMGQPFTKCIPNMGWSHGLPREYSLSTGNDVKFRSSRGVLANHLSLPSIFFYFEMSPLLSKSPI